MISQTAQSACLVQQVAEQELGCQGAPAHSCERRVCRILPAQAHSRTSDSSAHMLHQASSSSSSAAERRSHFETMHPSQTGCACGYALSE
jgi:hypothetical protein